jgi:TrmH family RNA methyltransferase
MHAGPAPAGLIRRARRLKQRKFRLADGRLLAEGPQAVREALAAGVVVALLATAEAAGRFPDLLAGEWHSVDGKVMAELADTVTPSGLLAVVGWAPLPGADWAAALAGAGRDATDLVLVLDSVRDPGNLGSAIRSADAFGARAVITTGDAVSVTNAKAVRATAGSLFHLPVVEGAELDTVAAGLRERGYTLYAADGAGAADLAALARDGALSGPTAWLMGNEAWGLRPEAAGLATAGVRIPMWGSAESLNLAMAATTVLYATATAQRAGG